MAQVATSNGGDILEVGFGMGISAGFIQESDIRRHIIMELNHDVAMGALEFAKKARYPIKVMEGAWQEQIRAIPDESIDGILFDTYPLKPEEIHRNHFEFFCQAYRVLRKGGILTYYSDESVGFSPEHLKQLERSGFPADHIAGEIFSVPTSAQCAYWGCGTLLVPIVLKPMM